MTKAYVIIRHDGDYHDENVSFFFDKDKANEECARMDVEHKKKSETFELSQNTYWRNNFDIVNNSLLKKYDLNFKGINTEQFSEIRNSEAFKNYSKEWNEYYNKQHKLIDDEWIKAGYELPCNYYDYWDFRVEEIEIK